MVVSNKDAIFNDDASWTKTNLAMPLVLRKEYKLNGNEFAILLYIINLYNRAVLTFQKSEKQRVTSVSYGDIVEYVGATKKNVCSAIKSLLDKGLIIRINKEAITTKDKNLDNGTKDKNLDNGTKNKSLDNGTEDIRKGRDKARYLPNMKQINKALNDYLDRYPELAD